MGDLARRGARGQPLRAHLQDPPRARRRHRRRRPRHRPVRPLARPAAARARRARWSPGPSPRRPSWWPPACAARQHGRRARRPRDRRRSPIPATRRDRPRGGRGRRRDRLGGPQPGAADAAQRARSAHTGASPCVRHELSDFKRSRTRSAARSTTSCSRSSRGRCARWLRSRGVRTEGLEMRASCRCRSARRTSAAARQPHRRDARAAAGLHRRPGRPAALRQAGDGRPQGVQAGARRRGDRQRQQLRAADDPRPGLAAELLDPAVQPHRHQRPGPAVPALRPRARAPGPLPGRLPAREARAGHGDHVLQRPHRASACSATTTRCPTST